MSAGYARAFDAAQWYAVLGQAQIPIPVPSQSETRIELPELIVHHARIRDATDEQRVGRAQRLQRHRRIVQLIRTAVKSLHLFLRINRVQQRRKPVSDPARQVHG